MKRGGAVSFDTAPPRFFITFRQTISTPRAPLAHDPFRSAHAGRDFVPTHRVRPLSRRPDTARATSARRLECAPVTCWNSLDQRVEHRRIAAPAPRGGWCSGRHEADAARFRAPGAGGRPGRAGRRGARRPSRWPPRRPPVARPPVARPPGRRPVPDPATGAEKGSGGPVPPARDAHHPTAVPGHPNGWTSAVLRRPRALRRRPRPPDPVVAGAPTGRRAVRVRRAAAPRPGARRAVGRPGCHVAGRRAPHGPGGDARRTGGLRYPGAAVRGRERHRRSLGAKPCPWLLPRDRSPPLPRPARGRARRRPGGDRADRYRAVARRRETRRLRPAGRRSGPS